MKEICVKTIIAGANHISHIQRTAKPQDLENQLCQQILGIDIFLDKKAKPWLIEVNQSPSFMTDSPLDEHVKKTLLIQSIKMMNLNWRRKNRYINADRKEKQRRLTGQPRATNYEKEEIRKKKLRIKDKFELNNLGNFERLYPLHPDLLEDIPENAANIELQNTYDEMIAMAKLVYSESAAGGFVKKPLEIPTRTAAVTSPDRGPPSKIEHKREPPGTVKKGVHKLNSLPPGASNGYYDNVAPIGISIQNSNKV